MSGGYRVLDVPAGQVLAALKTGGLQSRRLDVPDDAVAVGPPDVRGGRVLILIRSAEFSHRIDDGRYPTLGDE